MKDKLLVKPATKQGGNQETLKVKGGGEDWPKKLVTKERRNAAGRKKGHHNSGRLIHSPVHIADTSTKFLSPCLFSLRR